MQNSSQERRRNSAPGGLAQQRTATAQTPRRPIGAGGVRGASRAGSASVLTTHALLARKVQRKLSNGVAGFAAGGSSSDRNRSRPIRALSATPHVGQRRFDFVPTHPAVLVHVARSHPVGNALVAQPCHQPVEQGWRVALLDRSAKGAVFGANLIDEVGRPGQAADPMNQSGRMVQG